MLNRLLCMLFTTATLLAAPLTALADAEPQLPPPIPEPGSWLLFSAGAVGIGMALRRRR